MSSSVAGSVLSRGGGQLKSFLKKISKTRFVSLGGLVKTRRGQEEVGFKAKSIFPLIDHKSLCNIILAAALLKGPFSAHSSNRLPTK